MGYKIREKLKGKGGFTLIETVITAAIVAILTGLTSVGIYGYLLTSYLNRVNETAKTVFFASQAYILEQKQLGRLEEFNDAAAAYGGEVPEDTLLDILSANIPGFDREAYKENYNTETTAYVLYQKGSSDGANPLWHIVKEYTQDEKLLENTCLMEYDKKTGVVRAVFYSEKTDTFVYDGGRQEYDNVILRTPDELKIKRQGYYGVDTTGRPYSEVYVEDPANVALFNESRLFLQWEDINLQNREITDLGLQNALVYDVSVYKIGEDGNPSDILFKLKDIAPDYLSSGVTLAQADDGPAADGYRLAFEKDPVEKKITYRLILDDIHHSIYELYGSMDTNDSAYRDHVEVLAPVQASDTLMCTVTAKLDEDKAGLEAYSLPASSNRESANFGGGDEYNSAVLPEGDRIETGGSGRLEDGLEANPYTVAYARHFNNIRHALNTACYSQTASIDWSLPEEAARPYTERFEPITYKNEFTALADPYEGNYIVAKDDADQYFTLDNLTIDKPAMQKVGIFSQNRGTIRGMTLGSPSVTGSIITGVLTGENAGDISDVTITEGKVTGSHFLGGVTGKNLAGGSLTEIQADADVAGSVPYSGTAEATDGSRGWYVGGVAGLNEGKARKLSSAVLKADGKPQSVQRKVVGTRQVGGIFGANLSLETIRELVNNSLIALPEGVTNGDEIQDIGGIAGHNGQGTLSDCVNYGILQFDKRAALDGDTPKNIGGITGYNTGSLLRCSNELTSGAAIENLLKTCTDASHLQAGKLPEYLGKYVGGISGMNDKDGEIRDCASKGAVLGYEVVGGLVGKNLGNVRQSFSIRADQISVSGLVIGTGNMVGGIFGYNTGLDIEGYRNAAHVFGNGITGGITGFNGVAQEDGDGQILNLIDNMGTQGTPAYYAKLLGIENLSLTASPNAKISGCRNEGFVYALKYYSGGIAGINYGQIKNCDTEFTADARLANINKLGKADCVGGIAGYNTNEIDGTNTLGGSGKAAVELSANDFVGGIAGLNKGKIKGYDFVTGNIYGKGDCVGGLIGLNNNDEEVISGLTRNEAMKIEGGYFVGGILGCNVTVDSGRPAKFSGITTAGKGAIQGEAYVGGILGYNTYGKLTELFASDGELTRSKREAYSNTPSAGGSASRVAVFSDCTNEAQVKANRYVGGIMGYNSAVSQLWVNRCFNNGEISISDESKTGASPDGKLYYYIGGITGRNSKDGVIHHSVNNGLVSSPSTYLGGICEVNEGYVQYCSIGNIQYYVDDKKPGVEGENSVGGIVGLNRGGAKVISCQANEYAQIRGGNDTGGLVGTNDTGGQITDQGALDLFSAIGENFTPSEEQRKSVTHAYVNGKENTGGIVGRNLGMVENILVEEKAQVIGTQKVGGFVGLNEGTIGGKSDVITGLVNKAKLVQGDNEVGGIVGAHTAALVEKCINNGEVVARDKVSGTEEEPGYAGGIVGSVAADVTVSECVNYGTVVSNYSAAGGIAGYNRGIVQNSRNYGSVKGSTKRLHDTAAIGGIVGHNSQGGRVLECASRDKKNDPDGAKNNLHFYDDEENRIVGGYRVGGIIGFNDRAVFENKEAFNREVDITIETAKPEGTATNRSYIGGFIGTTDANPSNPYTTLLADYTYSGVIRSEGAAAGQQQCIGGIIGVLRRSVTLENCLMTGKIEGTGNNPGSGDNCGVGGLAGEAAGTIVVYPNGDGIYASNTRDTLVSGAKRVGGVAGETSNTFKVVLKTGKNGAEVTNQYYVNLATVQGGKGAGGFYGHAGAPSLERLENRGNIKPLDVNDKTSIGGIAGYSITANLTEMKYCRNLGVIGATPAGSRVPQGVGGLMGRWATGAKKKVSYCYNGQEGTDEGAITCGKENVGGLFGFVQNADIEDSCKNWGSIQVHARSVGGIAGLSTACRIGYQDGSIKPVIMNYGEIVYLGKSDYVGGIAGTTTGLNKIRNVANEGRIDGTRYTGTDWTVCGGITGYVNASAQWIVGCVNKAEINLPRLREVGGIAGKLNGADNALVTDCRNEGKVISTSLAGGVVGFISGTNGARLQNNVNEGEVYARRYSGGLYGQIQNSDLTISDDVNSGLVSFQGVKINGVGDVRDVGGCVGIITGNGKTSIKRTVNRGEVRYDYGEETENQTMSTVSRVGGIVGNAGVPLYINDCRNEGSINMTVSTGQIWNVGGIIGMLNAKSVIGNEDTADTRTQNTGTITTVGKSYNIGGIAGITADGSKIIHAENQGEIRGDSNLSQFVGGIAGQASGLVYSCSTTAGQVRGYREVGGLVGVAVGTGCKITSVGTGTGAVPERFDLSHNAAPVSGTVKVGGLIGSMKEATVYNLYNQASGVVTLNGRATGEGSYVAAGGLVGFCADVVGVANESKNAVKGVIAGCYNFAPVRFADGTSGNEYYIGGVMGYRKRLKNDQTRTAYSIIDCYDVAMDGGGVAQTLPPTAVQKAIWEVGNEPADAAGVIFSDPDDYQAFDDQNTPAVMPWRSEDKFKWNQESYEKMCLDAGITPSPDYTSQEAVLELMQNYKGFRLPVPPMGPVVGNQGFSYTFPFSELAGFYSRVGIKLYDGKLDYDTTEDKLEALTPFYESSVDRNIDQKMVSITGELNYPERIGKVISVAAYVEGISIGTGGELHYTQDSAKRIVQRFVLMPPLPTPEIEVVETQENDVPGAIQNKVKFEITNWAEYKKAAAGVYEALRELKDENGNPYPIYDEFLNGLAQFTVRDSYLPTQNGKAVGDDNWILSLDDRTQDNAVKIEEDGGKAYFSIDYTKSSNFTKWGTNNPWHKWEVQAIAKDNTKPLDPDDPGFIYRYLNSEKFTDLKYRLRTKLPAPTNPQVEYIGGTDPAESGTPSYNLKWTLPGNRTGIKGYRVEITQIQYKGPDGVTHTLDIDPSSAAAPFVKVAPGNNSTQSVSFTKAELKAMAVDYVNANGGTVDESWWDLDQPEFSLTWQVVSMSTDDTAYIESNPSAENSFELIRRAKPVENINVIRPDDMVNNIDIEWTDPQYDAAKPDNNRYSVEYVVMVGNQEMQRDTKTITGTPAWNGINLTGNLTGVASYDVAVSIVRLGVKGEFLDSEKAEADKVIGKKLDTLASVEAVPFKIEKDENTGEELIYFDVSWTGPGNYTADNCEGYRIEILQADGSKVTVSVDGFDTDRGVVAVSYDKNKNSDIHFYVSALGKAPEAGDSDHLDKQVHVPEDRLDAPESKTVKLSVSANSIGDGSGTDVLYQKGDSEPAKDLSVARNDYETGFNYIFDFDVIAATAVSGTKVELICEGNTLFESENASSPLNIPSNSIDLAGKTAVLKLANKTATPNAILPSGVVQIEFRFPKVQLKMPQITGFTRTSTPDADVYHVEYNQETDSTADEDVIRQGQTLRILKENADGTLEAVSFVPVSQDGSNPGPETDSYKIESGDSSVSFHFRFPDGVSYTADELKKMRISIRNTPKDSGSEADKYGPSLAEERGFDGVTVVTKLERETVSGNEIPLAGMAPDGPDGLAAGEKRAAGSQGADTNPGGGESQTPDSGETEGGSTAGTGGADNPNPE